MFTLACATEGHGGQFLGRPRPGGEPPTSGFGLESLVDLYTMPLSMTPPPLRSGLAYSLGGLWYFKRLV